MRCIMCDKCKKVIEDPKQVRILTCSRPMKKPADPSAGKPCNDVIWDKELCPDCAMAIETAINEAHTKDPETEEE